MEGGHLSGSEVLEDYCDGQVCRAHPLFSVHVSALQVFFYYDDLEVCNPLGSKAKVHKIGKSTNGTYTVISQLSAHGRLKFTGQTTGVGIYTEKSFVRIMHIHTDHRIIKKRGWALTRR